MSFGSQYRKCVGLPLWYFKYYLVRVNKHIFIVPCLNVTMLSITAFSFEGSAVFNLLTNHHGSINVLMTQFAPKEEGKYPCGVSENVVQYLSKGHIIVCVCKVFCLCWKEVL